MLVCPELPRRLVGPKLCPLSAQERLQSVPARSIFYWLVPRADSIGTRVTTSCYRLKIRSYRQRSVTVRSRFAVLERSQARNIPVKLRWISFESCQSSSRLSAHND